jgi:hypothetical protein
MSFSPRSSAFDPLTMTADSSPDKDIANDVTRPWNEKDKAANTKHA